MELGEPIAKGGTASIYLCGNRIYKLYNDYLPDTEAAYEASKQEYARSRGLPVPEIFEVTRINGKQAVVMEYVRGETLGEVLRRDFEHAERYLKLSADIQLQIHSLKADSLIPMTEKLRWQLGQARRLSEAQRAALRLRLDSMTYEKRLCHGDFHVFNLIQTDAGLVIIDWVDASAGDIRADVYRSYLLYSMASPELAGLYLRLYCQRSGLTQDEVFAWAPIIAGARLSEGVTDECADGLLDIVRRY